MRGPVNCCYLRSAWQAELYLTFMSRLREQDFIEISITYMNNNEFKHTGKVSGISIFSLSSFKIVKFEINIERDK